MNRLTKFIPIFLNITVGKFRFIKILEYGDDIKTKNTYLDNSLKGHLKVHVEYDIFSRLLKL